MGNIVDRLLGRHTATTPALAGATLAAAGATLATAGATLAAPGGAGITDDKTDAAAAAETRQGQRLLAGIVAAMVLTSAAWLWYHFHWHFVGWLPHPGTWRPPETTSPGMWWDRVAFSLLGVLAYALTHVASFYPQISKGQGARFRAFTPWYIATVLKGPLISLIVLLFLMSLSITVSGLTLDLTKLPPSVMLSVAFVLGFFSSVAREQLELIVANLFGRAYVLAQDPLSISPKDTQLAFGASQLFEVVQKGAKSQLVGLTWTTSHGSIVDGLFTAPATGVAPGQVVRIAAVPKDDNLPVAVTQVTLQPFVIEGPRALEHDQTGVYRLQPLPTNAKEVKWSISPDLNQLKGKGEGDTVVDGVYCVPADLKPALPGFEITVTCTAEDDTTTQVSRWVAIGEKK